TLIALSDGTFSMSEKFLSDPSAHAELGGGKPEAVLPVGAFLLPGEQLVLIDAGAGPFVDDGTLRGGNLLSQLESEGVLPEDVQVLALSHLHPDHTGWVATAAGDPIFTDAEVIVSAADWEHFMMGSDRSVPAHVRAALEMLDRRGRLSLIEGEAKIVPGLTALPAPGHTPGHTVFALHDRGEKALLLGDAVHCPQQLSHTDWEAVSDLDPALARRTRAALARDLESSGAFATGCHFPGLRAARFLAGTWH
ncbi:MAG: MBL fold metallo-hydrolase, partial [Acidimicrobiales bacterium]